MILIELEGWREKQFTHVSCIGSQKSHNGTSTTDSANSMTNESPEQIKRFFFAPHELRIQNADNNLWFSSFIYRSCSDVLGPCDVDRLPDRTNPAWQDSAVSTEGPTMSRPWSKSRLASLPASTR